MMKKKTSAMCLHLFALSIVFMFALKNESGAVPAAPVEQMLSQADGTKYVARQWGDEWTHGWETLDGYTIIYDESSKIWTYAVLHKNGTLTASTYVVGAYQNLNQLPQHTRPVRSQRIQSAHKAMAALRKSASVPPTSILTGTANIPVILIEFPDQAHTYAPQDFHTLLFDTSPASKSMKKYFEEVSYGAFSVSAGPAGVKGWYTASQAHDYYGKDDLAGLDGWPGDLVYEAVAAADLTINFADYDTDKDCYVDAVMIVHAGTGEEMSGSSSDIWSHRSWLSLDKLLNYGHRGSYTTNDADAVCPNGYIVDSYVLVPELNSSQPLTRAAMGIFAHEYSHVYLLPDLYDYDGSSEGVGSWDLMGRGNWNTVAGGVPGDTPAHLSAWSKYYMGWIAPVQVKGTLSNESIESASGKDDVYQFLSGTPTAGEYFLIENRQRSGFDEGLPGSGLLIWHIDGYQYFFPFMNYTECYPSGPPCARGHYGVALVQADNQWDLEKKNGRGDFWDPFSFPFNTALSDSTVPAGTLFDGSLSHISIQSINASGTIMTANMTALPLHHISVMPRTFDFGSVSEGHHSFPMKFRVSNTGNEALTVSDIVQTGVNVSEFGLNVGDGTKGTCGHAPFVVAPGRDCFIEVAFTPLVMGDRNAAIALTSNDLTQETFLVPLSGSGKSQTDLFTPDVPHLVSPADGSIVSGATVTFTWGMSADADGDAVTYKITCCEDPFFIGCTPIDATVTTAGSSTYGAEMGLLFAGMAFLGGIKGNMGKRLLMIAMVLTAVIGSCDNNGSSNAPQMQMRYTASGLGSGKTYYWKVEAHDGKGGKNTSEAWRFRTK